MVDFVETNLERSPPLEKEKFLETTTLWINHKERLIAGHGHAAVLVTCVNNAVKFSGKTTHRKESKLI